MNEKRSYDSTIARIAGNVASGLIGRGTYDGDPVGLSIQSVLIARLIVDATEHYKFGVSTAASTGKTVLIPLDDDPSTREKENEPAAEDGELTTPTRAERSTPR